MDWRTCEGCEHLLREDAGRGYEFAVCALGKFDRAGMPVVERVRKGYEVGTAAPAWCKMGFGKMWR